MYCINPELNKICLTLAQYSHCSHISPWKFLLPSPALTPAWKQELGWFSITGLPYQNQTLRCHCSIKHKFLCHTQPTFSPDEFIILSFHYPERTDSLFPVNTRKSSSNDTAFFQFIISVIQNKCEKKICWKQQAAGAQDWRLQEAESPFLLLIDSPISDLSPGPSSWVISLPPQGPAAPCAAQQ